MSSGVNGQQGQRGEMTEVHVVVMGVAGCGKSTVALGLARHFGWVFAEGDDLHPRANIEKMRAGRPLSDDDRAPWLERIVRWTEEQDAAGRSTVVACSALSVRYRDRLRSAPGATIFVHLTGSPHLLQARIASRSGHFMPESLLKSQLETLEPLGASEVGVTLDSTLGPAKTVRAAVEALHLMDPELFGCSAEDCGSSHGEHTHLTC